MISLSHYNKNWALNFKREKILIEHFTQSSGLIIEHVGSTSVPGLKAKPIIDILIGINSLKDADKVIDKMVINMDYQYIAHYENTMPYRRYFKKTTNTISFNVHLVEIDSQFWKDLLLFRDILRSEPSIATEYEILKINLAANHNDVATYAEAKSEFIIRTLAIGRIR